MHAIKKLNADIRSSRRRMQAGQSPNAVKSAQQTGETKQKKPAVAPTNTEQPKYIDSGGVSMKPW